MPPAAVSRRALVSSRVTTNATPESKGPSLKQLAYGAAARLLPPHAITDEKNWDGATMHRRSGFTLIELLIVIVVIGILAAIAANLFWSAKEEAFISTMKSDLRVLSMAQENYHSEHMTYAATAAALPDFQASKGVTITITFADERGWAARAEHASYTGHQCGVFYEPATAAEGAPAAYQGVIACN